MNALRTLAVVAMAVGAFGSVACGSDGDGGGGGGSLTGLDGSKTIESLTAAEWDSACRAADGKLTLSDAAIRGICASQLAATPNATCDAAAVDACFAQSKPRLTEPDDCNSGAQDVTRAAGCKRTVAEFEKCSIDQLAAANAAFAAATCDAPLTSAPPDPASCAAIKADCPNLFDN